MGVEEWYIRCIKDHLALLSLLKNEDYAEITLNESDKTFVIEIYHIKDNLRASQNSKMKGRYEVEEDYLNLIFLNKTFKVKI